jgi:DNA-directed RNA polymerase subunit RPC12/RpoP
MAASCCPRFEWLGANGYIDGTLVYVQKLDIHTDFPAERRKYFHCVQCGSDVDHHPDYKCQALQNMLNNEQIQQIRGRYSFNLVPREVFREMQEGKGYPEPFGIHNCPYCGARYTYVK